MNRAAQPANKPTTGRWLEGRVLENLHWTATLFSLRVEAPRLPFEAGQFVRIALDVGSERVARPFSFVNAPDDDGRTKYVLEKGEDRQRIDGAVADVLALEAAMTMDPPEVLPAVELINL